MTLSEPKRKMQWSLNPRGAVWANDDNKLGQRLLQKMGWSKGKGLGKNEDGNPDCIKVTTKNDSKGMGYKGYDDVWIDHQKDFGAILNSLNGNNELNNNNGTNQLKSLEERSSKSRKRVQYSKYIRSKDLSSRSSKDLQCIFGTLDPNQKSEQFVESSNIVNSGNMEEYFKKMKKLKNERITSKTDTVQGQSSERTQNNAVGVMENNSEDYENAETKIAECEATSFDTSDKIYSSFNYNYVEQEDGKAISVPNDTKKKLKRRKFSVAEFDSSTTMVDETHECRKKGLCSTSFETQENSDQLNRDFKTKKQKLSKIGTSKNDVDIPNNRDESGFTDAITVDDNLPKKHKKKSAKRLDETYDSKKKEGTANIGKLEDCNAKYSEIDEENTKPTNLNKIKKKKKLSGNEIDEGTDEMHESSCLVKYNDNKPEAIKLLKIKKTKKKNICQLPEESVDRISDSDARCISESEEVESVKIKKKKRKRDDEKSVEHCDSEKICQNSKKTEGKDSEITVNEEINIKKKKVKRVTCQNTDDVTELDNDVGADCELEVKEETESKKKAKKRKMSHVSEEDSTKLYEGANENNTLEEKKSKKRKRVTRDDCDVWEESTEIDNATVHHKLKVKKSSKIKSKNNELDIIPDCESDVAETVSLTEKSKSDVDDEISFKITGANSNIKFKNQNYVTKSPYFKIDNTYCNPITRIKESIASHKSRLENFSMWTNNRNIDREIYKEERKRVIESYNKNPEEFKQVIQSMETFKNSNFFTVVGYPYKGK